MQLTQNGKSSEMERFSFHIFVLLVDKSKTSYSIWRSVPTVTITAGPLTQLWSSVATTAHPPTTVYLGISNEQA